MINTYTGNKCKYCQVPIVLTLRHIYDPSVTTLSGEEIKFVQVLCMHRFLFLDTSVVYTYHKHFRCWELVLAHSSLQSSHSSPVGDIFAV